MQQLDPQAAAHVVLAVPRTFPLTQSTILVEHCLATDVLVVRSVAVVRRRRLLVAEWDTDDLATAMFVWLFEEMMVGDNNKIPMSTSSLSLVLSLYHVEATW
jgi:hypothetical protein